MSKMTFEELQSNYKGAIAGLHARWPEGTPARAALDAAVAKVEEDGEVSEQEMKDLVAHIDELERML